MLNVQRLRLLREIASRGSIARAAEALFLTPSAVSQQMAVLEREAGTPLLERAGRSVRLTDAGTRLVVHTERVLRVLEEAESDLATFSADVAGTLRTCAFPTAARALMVPVIASLRESFPALDVHMVDLEPEDSLPALKSGQLDVVLTFGYDQLPEPEDPGVERLLLLTEPMYVALPASHPLVGRSVHMRDLASEQWIVGRDGSPFLDVVIRVAREAGFEPRVDIHSNDYQVILAAVGAGLGVAFVSPLGMIAAYPDVRLAALEDMPVRRRVVAAIRRGSSGAPAIAAALNALRAEASALEPRLAVPLAERQS